MQNPKKGERGVQITIDPEFAITGNAKVGDRDCCGKPQGCTNMNSGCAYLKHPYKRWVRGEITLTELEARNPMAPVLMPPGPIRQPRPGGK